jgi:hypothetical protein
MSPVAPMHAIIAAKHASIKALESNKKVDTRQVVGILKSIRRLETQAREHTVDILSTRMLDAFMVSIIRINDIAKHWNTLDEAMVTYLAAPKKDRLIVYRSPIDKTFMVINVSSAKKPFFTKMQSISIDIDHRHSNGIFSNKQYKLLRRRLENIKTSYHSYFENCRVNIENYVAPIIPDTIYPSRILLTEFHVCGRKKVYVTIEEAQKAATLNNLETYTCVFCTGYHIGHGNTENDYRYLVGSAFYPRHRSTWKRYPEKAKAFLENRI